MTTFLFDLEILTAEAARDNAPAWAGPSLRYTNSFLSPSVHAAVSARNALENPTWSRDRLSGSWHPWITHTDFQTVDHDYAMLCVDLRCRCFMKRDLENDRDTKCSCVGDLMFQTICTRCEANFVTDNEKTAVEAWHDHAFPGWRDLPVIPPTRSDAARATFIEVNYPEAWKVQHAPIRTTRLKYGTRHVPGRSPWGGFDLTGAVANTP